MIIKQSELYSIFPHNIFFSKSSLKTIKILTMSVDSKHKERKTSLRKDLKRWNSHWIHRTHFRYRFKVSNIISPFSVRHHHTVLLEASQLWNTFSERNVTTHSCDILVITKFISIMNWNQLPSKFHPLVTVLCSGATHTQDYPWPHDYTWALWSISSQRFFRNIPSSCAHYCNTALRPL